MTKNEGRVGYKRPPIEHRFKPGISGNPKGRPKGQKSLAEEVRTILKRQITINDGGIKRKVSVVQAVLRQLVAQGVGKGDLRAIEKLLTLADSYASNAEGAALGQDDQRLIAEAFKRYAMDHPDAGGGDE